MNKMVETLVLTDGERKEMESRFDRQILFHSCVAGAAGLLPMEAAAGAAVTYVCGKVYCRAVGNLLFSGRKVEVDAVNSCIEDLCRDEKFVESLRMEAKSRLRNADYSKFAKEAEDASRIQEDAA